MLNLSQIPFSKVKIKVNISLFDDLAEGLGLHYGYLLQEIPPTKTLSLNKTKMIALSSSRERSVYLVFQRDQLDNVLVAQCT